MKSRFQNTTAMYVAFAFVLLKILLTFGTFLYNPLLPATFPSVLYIYVFIFSVFSTNFQLALQFLPFMFIGSCLPAVAAVLVLRTNRKGAGLASFFLMLLCLADILFIIVHPLVDSLLFTIGAIVLNLAIIACTILMRRWNPKEAD